MNEYLAQAISEVNNLNEGEEFCSKGILGIGWQLVLNLVLISCF